jgi:hypothetical protein
VTHRCPRNGAAGIRASSLGSVELRTAGTHAPGSPDFPSQRSGMCPLLDTSCGLPLTRSQPRQGSIHRQKCPPLFNPFSLFRHPVLFFNNKVSSSSILSPQSLPAGRHPLLRVELTLEDALAHPPRVFTDQTKSTVPLHFRPLPIKYSVDPFNPKAHAASVSYQYDLTRGDDLTLTADRSRPKVGRGYSI